LNDELSSEQTSKHVDWFIFCTGSAVLLAVVVTLLSAPEWSASAIDQLYEVVTTRVGVIYVLAAIMTLGFLLWLALSTHGMVVLGDKAIPVHSTYHWASMLFCAGIGASLIYWGATEWTFYYVAPPFGVEPRSDAAITWAASYGMFHWGPIGWAFYCLPAVALGCSYHVKKIPSLRLSSACHSVLKSQTDKWPGRVIDLLFIVGLLGTAATGLGFGTSVVASAINRLTGLEDGIALQVVIILIATAIIAYSVYRGLDRGIKVLSAINSVLALCLIGFVLVVGPTAFILEMGVTSLGRVVQGFVQMATWTDPLQRADFIESWTVFYWAWWLAMGPFVGMFICKISEGRTIRQVIFGTLGYGSLGCALFFIVLGNYALYLELNSLYPVVQEAVELSPSTAIAGIVALLPMGSVLLVFVAVIGLIFMATTYDSASYTLAAGATRSMTEHEHPARWHRVFWAVALGLLPISLLFIGGLRELQTASLVASIPLVFVYLVLAVATVRMLNESNPGSGN
jgi:BCCT family betaine/carnitine transporter|tara:strand:+ start:209 stop:1744 length:1536 start_codon:yes stop_codon:yes gene_type:complete